MKPMDDARLKSMVKTTKDMTRSTAHLDFLPVLKAYLFN